MFFMRVLVRKWVVKTPEFFFQIMFIGRFEIALLLSWVTKELLILAITWEFLCIIKGFPPRASALSRRRWTSVWAIGRLRTSLLLGGSPSQSLWFKLYLLMPCSPIISQLPFVTKLIRDVAFLFGKIQMTVGKFTGWVGKPYAPLRKVVVLVCDCWVIWTNLSLWSLPRTCVQNQMIFRCGLWEANINEGRIFFLKLTQRKLEQTSGGV